MSGPPLILPSARRHQREQEITDEDILHAWQHPVGVVPGTNEMTLILGKDARDRLLEIGQVACGDYPPPIVHAMLARRHLIEKLQGRSR